MIRKKKKRLREIGAPDLFAETHCVWFFETFTKMRWSVPQVHVSCLRLDDEILSPHWGLVFRGRSYWLIPRSVWAGRARPLWILDLDRVRALAQHDTVERTMAADVKPPSSAATITSNEAAA